MGATKSSKLKSNHKKIFVASTVVGAIVAFVLWLMYFVVPYTIFDFLTNYYMPNYAKDTTMSIERALIKSGAKKVCESAADGRTASNPEPSYIGYYQFSMADEEVVPILQRVTKENGYELESVTSEDKTVQNFADRSTKQSTHLELLPGKISLHSTVYSDRSEGQLAYCGGKGLHADATHTILTLGIRLPPFKQ